MTILKGMNKYMNKSKHEDIQIWKGGFSSKNRQDTKNSFFAMKIQIVE